MWIPLHSEPCDHNVRYAIQLGAQAVDRFSSLRSIYDLIVKEFPEGIPAFVNVSTHYFEGGGLQISPVQAFHAHRADLLGEQQMKVEHGFGKTNYSRSFYWCPLDTHKLYDLLGDENLPAPLPRVVEEK